MLDFDDARLIDSWCYDLVLGDAGRANDRALIDRLANGNPPYTEKEQEENQIKVNVNHLTLTRLAADAQAQYINGLMSTGEFMTQATDWGPIHKRDYYSTVFEKEINRALLNSVSYYEYTRGGFASTILHGIAPEAWENEHKMIPRRLGPEDLLIPSDTLLGFDNLPFFAIRRSFTSNELKYCTRRTKRDNGWNIPFVNQLINWADREMTTLLGQNWPQQWSPEKWESMDKEGGALSWSDRCPTIDVFDVYGYVEATDDQPEGWVRRMILDSWSQPAISGGVWHVNRREDRKNTKGRNLDQPGEDDFIFTSGTRPVAAKWENLIAVQFANLSMKSPFRYHAVRGMGMMLYALCHLDNRLSCKFEEAVFEALMQYFKVRSLDDVNNAMRLELYNLGFIDDTLKPVPQAERWNVNAQLAELGLQSISDRIDKNSKAFTQDVSSLNNKTEKTKAEVLAKVQAANALVSAGITQTHVYKRYEYMEMTRRVCIPNSRDPVVRDIRERCLRQGLPEKLLNEHRAWDTQSAKMVGGGNQTMELMISQELLSLAPQLDPEAKRKVIRKFILNLTKDPALALELMPDQPNKITAASHDAQLAAGAMMNGIDVKPPPGSNYIDYTKELLNQLAIKVQAGQKTGMVNPKDLAGMKLMANSIAQCIQIIAANPQDKQLVANFKQALAKMVALIKAFEQRLQAAAKAKAQQNGQNGSGEAQAKVMAPIIMAKTKSKIKEAEAAQKLKHKELAFKQKLLQDATRTRADVARTDLTTAAEIRRGSMRSLNENEGTE